MIYIIRQSAYDFHLKNQLHYGVNVLDLFLLIIEPDTNYTICISKLFVPVKM